jgi:hypothetical protein
MFRNVLKWTIEAVKLHNGVEVKPAGVLECYPLVSRGLRRFACVQVPLWVTAVSLCRLDVGVRIERCVC